MIKKTFTIDDKKVVVYDGIFTYQENLEIFEFICQQPYIRSNIDNNFANIKDVNVKWSCLLRESNPITHILNTRYHQIDELKNTRHEILRQYINYSTMETVDMIHYDSRSDQPGFYTLLHYGNYVWDKNWHGETVFYNADASEILLSTMPKPGRLVFFDSSIPHCARAPSKLTEYSRYTIATKLLII